MKTTPIPLHFRAALLWRCLLLVGLALFASCSEPLSDDEASASVRYLPFAIVVPKGEELRNAENYAASHPGHQAVWAETSRPLPHYGSAAAMVLKDTPFDELQRGMIVVYVTKMGVRAGGILVAKQREGWVVKDWGADDVKDRFLQAGDIVGVVVLVFVAPDAKTKSEAIAPFPNI